MILSPCHYRNLTRLGICNGLAHGVANVDPLDTLDLKVNW